MAYTLHLETKGEPTMSKGISKKQQVILDLLSGDRPRRIYSGSGGNLDTAELLSEVEEWLFGDKDPTGSRKQRMGSLIRSCKSLYSRGLIKGVCVPDCDNPGRKTITWSIPSKEKDITKSTGEK
jgi:hypothetical protein